MYNHLNKYLAGNDILYKNQFSFQGDHSIKHAMFQMIDQIRNSFKSNQFS